MANVLKVLMTICIFCGGHTQKDENPIPLSILEFQPPTGIPGELSQDRFTAKFCCQKCYKNIHFHIASAAIDSAKVLP